MIDSSAESGVHDRAQRTELVKQLALRAGFSRVGIARACDLADDHVALTEWLDAGHHGEMAWLARNTPRRCDPGLVVDNARSVICLAVDYDSDAPRTHDDGGLGEGRAWISRYAWGDDYHRVIERRLKAFARAVGDEVVPHLPDGFRGDGDSGAPWVSARDFRFYVDHGPVLERAWAVRAGLGWRGRHGLVVDPERGSFFFLAVVLTSVDLLPDDAIADHCGTCTACVDACPTDAILAVRSVDSRKCISYLTIEAPVPLSDEQTSMLHSHVFGCDICQDVCPFNRFSRPGDPAFAPRPGSVAPKLQDLLSLSPTEFAERFRASPVKRRKISQLQWIAEAHVRDEQAAADTADNS